MRKITEEELQKRLTRLSEHIAQRRGKLTASEAARFIARSTSWTRHQFTPHMGMTFRHACLTAKLAHGEALLRTTQLKIADIATQLGYSERTKFETSFKRRYGLTPAMYRRTLGEIGGEIEVRHLEPQIGVEEFKVRGA